MAKQNPNAPIPDKKPKTSSSCGLLTCFGSFQDEEVPDNMNRPETTGSRRRNRWASWPTRLRVKIKSAAKTVPVVDHLSFSEKPVSVDKIEPAPPPPSKSKSFMKLKSSKSVAENLTGKRQAPFSSRKPPILAPVAAADQKTPKQQAKDGPAQNTVPDPDPANDTAGQKRRSFCRKIDAIRTGSISQPGSPVDRTKPATAGKIGRAMSHPAASFPSVASNYVKPAKKRTGPDETDPVVGMSIILVTLIIMLLWGRVCAILSTSAWFYFIPRLSKSAKSSWNHRDRDDHKHNWIFDDRDLSYEYKKRVVLEGFLERTHRSSQ